MVGTKFMASPVTRRVGKPENVDSAALLICWDVTVSIYSQYLWNV